MTDPVSSLTAWPHWRWEALSTRDFQARAGSDLLQRTVAVLPLGATEQHGPHLPLCVDTAITDSIIDAMHTQWQAQAAAVRPPLLVLPTQSIGFSPEHSSFAGTLSLSASTVLALWNDIGAGIAASGVRRVLLFNSHGGNVSVMDMVARQLRQQHGLLTYGSSWFNLPRSAEIAALSNAHEDRFGVHAGEDETAIMRYLSPELVAMEYAQDFRSMSEQRAAQFALLGNGKSAKMGWMMQDYNPQGAAGNATAATAEKGQLLVEHAGQQLLQLIDEISQQPWPL